jgi:hypothetical protein
MVAILPLKIAAGAIIAGFVVIFKPKNSSNQMCK